MWLSPLSSVWPKPSSRGVKSHTPSYFSRIASASRDKVSTPVTRSASPSTTTSSPSFHVLTPVVTATAVECARFCAFCSSGPVQNTKPSSTHAPINGVTCGRPSVRTVVSLQLGAGQRVGDLLPADGLRRLTETSVELADHCHVYTDRATGANSSRAGPTRRLGSANASKTR